MGRHRERDVEIIELIIPTAQPARPSPPSPPSPHRRQVWPLAAVAAAVTILVGAAVVWPDHHGRDTRHAAPPPESAVTSTTLRPLLQPDSATPGAPLRFVTDPPSGWSVYSADLLSPPDESSWFGLWATADATATTGQWMTVTLTSAAKPLDAVVDSTRALVNGFEASSPIADPGLRRVVVPLNGSSAILLARGMDDVTLGTIAAGLTSPAVRGGPPGIDVPPDLVAVASGADLASVISGDPVSEIRYTEDDAHAGSIDVTLTVGQQFLADDGADIGPPVLRTLLLDPVGWRGSAAVMTAGTTEWWTGRFLDHPEQRVLRWRSGEHVFTLEGPVDLATLQAFASATRVAAPPEWEHLLYFRRPGLQLGQLVQVAAGTTTDGHGWLAGLRIASRDGVTLDAWAAAPLDTPQGPPYGPRPEQPLPDVPHISSMLVPGATYVFASTPATGTRQALRIIVGDRTVEVPFVTGDPTSSTLVAAYAFSEPTGFQAEVVDAS